MDGYTLTEWIATGVVALMIVIVTVVLVRCVWTLKRSTRDE